MGTHMKGLTVVVPNKEGSAISITEDGACISIVQKKYEVVPVGVLVEVRKATLVDDIQRMLSLNLQPGDKLKGDIIIGQEATFYSENEEDVDGVL